MAKVDWNLDYNEQETAHVNDVEFHVKKRIPHEKKMELAEEYAGAVAIIDEDGTANRNPYADMYWVYLLIKYYTDIELHEDDNIGWINDYATEHGLLNIIKAVCEKDYWQTYGFAEGMADMVIEAWTQSHSLAGILSKLTSDEEMKKLSEAAPLNEELIDLLHTKQEIDQGTKIVPLAEFAKKDKD